MSPFILRAVLASLPVLSLARKSETGLLYGIAGAGVLILSGSVFFLVRHLLPRTAERVSFILLLLTFALAAEKILQVSVLFLVSLLILSPPELFQKRNAWKGAAKKIIWSALFYLAFLSFHGVLSEALGLGAGIRFFQHPAGSYFLSGLAACCANLRKRGVKP